MHQKRRDRLETALGDLEAEFRTRLIEALRRCEQGAWGLFGQNDHIDPGRLRNEAYASSGAQKLDELGSEITQIREELGMTEPYSLYAQFLEKRSLKGKNTLGEARLASAWLQELTA
jgi:hypothetical protein